VAGVIEASRSDAFAEGDQVFGMSVSGAYAEYSTAPTTLVARKPTDLSFVEAAAIPVAGMTAWEALLGVGGLESGQTALVAGAAGGVGHFAVQFAKLAGARVIGTGSDRNREFVTALGADEYVDYTRQEVADAVSEVDLAFDTVGGETTGSLVGALRDGGTLVTIAGAPPEEAATARGIRTERLVMSPSAERMAQIAELISDQDVRVEVAEAVPLAEVARAHALSEGGHVRGKLVLTLT
jgi:NADPH:quinone reductase-like Zn-dependent oxidoreductase